jgi:two-component system CheB/CheR fusion protein
VIFGRNDLTQDAPISRVDILACRNTLMYLNAETQSHCLAKLSFALRPNGILFLGKAEMLINHSDAFKPIDLKRRFFRKTAAGLRARADYPRFSYRGTALGDPDEPELTVSTAAFSASPVAQLVVDADGAVALINRRAATLFALGERDVGRPFQDLELSYRPVELRSHMTTVVETGQPILLREMPYHRAQLETTFLDISLVPLADERARLIGVTISFTDVTRFRQLQSEVEATNRQLETAYEELQSTNEELETTNEELQSTVEELETTNEELQSSNEELETMNEELQSMNDELQTTNEELRERTSEVDALNGFMESVLGGLNAAIIVVGPDLKVRFWNRQSQELWGLREDEAVGHHLFDLDSGIPHEALRQPVQKALDQHEGKSDMVLEAVNRRGRTVQLRVTVAALDGAEPERGGAMMLMEVDDRDAGKGFETWTHPSS